MKTNPSHTGTPKHQYLTKVAGGMLCAVLAMAACQEKVEHGGKTPLVQVNDRFLYQEDVAQTLPYGVTGTDSAALVREFVRKWIEEQVLYEKAEHNVRGDGRIERMVADYRRTLVMNNYEQMLLQQKMPEELSEEELQRYYSENKQLFVLEEPVVKGLFIKVPLASPGLKDLRRWYKENSEEAFEKLEAYAFRNAVIYEFFYEHWVPVSEIEGKVIVDLAELGNDFDKNRNIEVKDEEYCYLLHIEEYVRKGETKPYDLARHEIIDLLANNRKVEFMKRVKEDLYNQSVKAGRIKYYYNETKQAAGDTVRHGSGSHADAGTK